MGQGISLTGTWMQRIGQSWLVLELTQSGTALGLVTAMQALPVLILGPWGGVFADRFSKRTLLLVTQAGAGLLAIVLAALVAMQMIELWMVYILAALLGFINAVDNPTRQSFVIEMVGNEHLRNAVTLNSTVVNMARILGPAIAGALIATVGIAACFFVNGISYLAVVACLLRMKSSELYPTEPVRWVKGELLKGFRYIGSTPLLRDVLIMMALVGTFTFEFQISLALIAKYSFQGTASAYALLTSAMGVGAVMGGLISASWKNNAPQGLPKIALGFGIAVFLAAASPNIALAALAMVMVGICSIMFTSLGNTILQLESAPHMRSRVMAFWSVAFMGSTPIGGPIVGWIGEYVNPRWGLGIGGAAALAASLFGFFAMKKYASRNQPGELISPELSVK